MGFVQRDIQIIGSRKLKTVRALFDSGAYRNYIRTTMYDGDTADDIGFHIFEGTRESILANGSLSTGDWVRFKEIRIEEVSLQEPLFVVMDNLTWDVIIGVELMQTLGLILDPPKERVILNL